MFNSSTVLTPASSNPMKDFEVDSPPDDSISCMAFSPATVPQNFLVAGSWDSSVRCWEIDPTGKSVAKSIQSMTGPVLDVCWSDDGSKVFMASCDKMVKCWDLVSNQAVQVASHDAPIKTCHWIKGSNYSCLMTGSWDKTLKFWDTRSPNPMLTLNLPDRCYCADVDYPYAVVGTPGKEILVYQLEGTPQEHKKIPSSLTYVPRCIAIFRDKKNAPSGYAVGNTSGRIAIQNFNETSTRDNFTFKCHRLYNESTRYQEIYAVNDLAFHPVHGTLVTVGGDGIFTFWDKDSRSKLKSSESMGQPITTCCFNHDGQILAYSVSYDWSKGHEFNNPMQKNCIFLRSCFEELKPKEK